MDGMKSVMFIEENGVVNVVGKNTNTYLALLIKEYS